MTEVITVWDVWNFRDRLIEFNHISMGYDEDAMEPTPLDKHQRVAWYQRGWAPRRAFLVDGTVFETEGKPT